MRIKEVKVQLEEGLHRKLKAKSALAGESLKDYISGVLTAHLKE